MTDPGIDRGEMATGPAPREQRGRMAGDASVVMGSEVVSIGLRYGGAILMSRILGLAWFGSVTLALTVANLFSTFSVLGVSPGALPFLARALRSGKGEEARAVVRAAWRLVGATSLVVALLTFVLAPWLATAVFGDSALARLLRPLCLLIVFSALTTASTGLIQGFLGVRMQAAIDRILVTAVTVAGLGLTWVFDWGLAGVLAAAVAGPLVGLLVAVGYLRRLAPSAPHSGSGAALPLVRALARESWPLMGVSLSAFVLTWMDVLLMGVFRSPEEVGLYGACARIAPAVMLVHNAAGPVFLARLSRHFVSRDWNAIGHLYRTTGLWSLWSGATIACVFLVWGRELLALFGPEFVAGTTVLSLLTLGRAVSAAAGMCGRMLSITGQARLALANMVLMIVSNGLLDLLWIPRYGAIGAASATCLCIAAVNLLQTVEVWLLYRLHPFTWRSVLGLLGTLGLGGLALQWREGPGGPMGWTVALALFLLASAALYLVGGAGDVDRAFLRALLQRRRP